MTLQRKTPLKNKPCRFCGALTHTSWQCFNKPRKTIRKNKPDLTYDQTRLKWFAQNPGPWVCYLRISKGCLHNLDRSEVTLDHVIPRGKGKKYKYAVINLKPACGPCNSLKGSRSIESMVPKYRWLRHLLPLVAEITEQLDG